MSDADPTVWAFRVGRALIAVPFVTGASRAWHQPAPLAEFARKAGLARPDELTKATAGAMLVGAAAVGTSLAPVLGGVVLAGSLVGTTAVVHPFWRDRDAASRAVHQRAFIANCGLLGGIIVMTAHAYTHPTAIVKHGLSGG